MMYAPPRIRAVLFDLGGTLVDYHDFEHWTELARRCFIEVDEEELSHAFFDIERETDTRSKTSFTDFWALVLARASGRTVERASAERFVLLARERPGFNRLYSDARRCLERLKTEGRRMAVVSNSSSEARCRTILHETGILPFFERVVSSGTEGVEKPDPEIFRRALVRMDVRPEDSFYVGNLAFTDAQAAREAGLAAVWLNRAGTGMSDDPPEITSLLELPLSLQRWEGVPTPEGGRGRRAA